MALGPMSTPLRSWPRSMGTPKSPTGSRSFSDKGSPSRTSWVGRCFEASHWRPPDGVDPAEEHVGGLVAEHALVAVEVCRGGACLVGEEVLLRVEARGQDGLLERHPEIDHVYDRLEDGRGYARGARGTERDQAALLRGDDGRAHVGDETFPRPQRVESSGIQLRLAQGVVHRDAGAGNDEPRAVAHARGYGDGEPVAVHARKMRGVGGSEGSEDPAPLPGRVFLPGQPLGDLAVFSTI